MEVVVFDNQEDFIQKLGIILLNCLVCQVDGEEKFIFGELGVIEVQEWGRDFLRERVYIYLICMVVV